MYVRSAMTDGTGNFAPTVLRKWPVSSMITAFSASTKLIARGTEMTASGSQLLPLRRSTRPCKFVNPPRPFLVGNKPTCARQGGAPVLAVHPQLFRLRTLLHYPFT